MKIKYVFLVMLVACSCHSFAQTAIVKGKILNNSSKAGFNDLKVALPSLKVFTTTDGEGNFTLTEIPYGQQLIVITGISGENDSIRANVDKHIVDLGDINVIPRNINVVPDNSVIPTITIEDNKNSQDEDGSSANSNSTGLFISNQDPFLYAAAYTFSLYYYKPRGFNSLQLLVNGISVEDKEHGYAPWTPISGLSDVLRNSNITYGLRPSEYDYGKINGTAAIDATAADQRAGTRATYTSTNRYYRNLAMLTHNSGLMKNGWAWSLSASHRWAEEGYVKGTFYDGYSMYGSVSKVIKKSTISITGIAVPTKRGRASLATDEAYQLAGDNHYNSDWGYQNGKKRNSKVTDISQPIFIANYTYKPSDRTRWNTSVGYEFGRNNSSTIDRYNAYSPDPDYYRNLPSYYTTKIPPDTKSGEAIRDQLLAHPEQMQINWDEMYQSNYINYETLKDANGIPGNNVTGRRSLYVLSNYVDNLKKASFNTNIVHSVDEHTTLYGGINFVSQNNRNYKQLTDLLGGDYYINFNQFATQQITGTTSYNQNDLRHPNQALHVGDKYGYDHSQQLYEGHTWGQASFVYNHIDLFASADAGYNTFSRTGYMQNGLYPDNSYGKSPSQSFFLYRVKGGITYKFDLRNFIFVNADYSTQAPLVSNTYISIDTRDFVVDHPKTVKLKTLECGYLLKSTIFSAQVVGYVTDINDYTMIKRFYYDDLGSKSFVSYVMNDVGMRSIGTEASVYLRLTHAWSLSAAAAIGQAFYTNSPMVTVYSDNNPAINTSTHKVYIKNYYVGVGPQSVYNLGVNYKPSSKLRANVNFNYIDRNYIEIYPERRTPQAAALIPAGSPAWNAIYNQERLPGFFIVDVSASKYFDLNRIYPRLHHSTQLSTSLGIGNLLNKTDIKVSGYEQLRYNFAERTPSSFSNKYSYAMGINYYATISLYF